MKITSIIFSPTGGTRRVVDAVLSGIRADIEEINLMSRDIENKEISVDSDSLVFIGIPSYGGRAPQTAMKRLAAIHGNNAKCVLVAAYGNREYEDTLIEMYDGAVQCGFIPIAAVSGIAEHSIDREMAKGRPDGDDEKVLMAFGEKIAEKAGSLNRLESIPGSRPYKALAPGSNCPQADETCVNCGRCRDCCPVEAIDDSMTGDSERCISCMGCISVCPVGARKLNNATLKRIHEFLLATCKVRKEPELFI
ncbi:MAG: 4Fe-4S binding protein [Emergencia sp.]